MATVRCVFGVVLVMLLAACQAETSSIVNVSATTGASVPLASTKKYNPERLLISNQIDESAGVCELKYYPEMPPATSYDFDEVGVDDDIETLIPRHYTGLGIAALSSESARSQLKAELIAHARGKSFISFLMKSR